MNKIDQARTIVKNLSSKSAIRKAESAIKSAREAVNAQSWAHKGLHNLFWGNKQQNSPKAVNSTNSIEPMHFTKISRDSSFTRSVQQDSKGHPLYYEKNNVNWHLDPKTLNYHPSNIPVATMGEGGDKAKAKAKPQPQQYQVKPGDSLAGIAKQHGLKSWQELHKLNPQIKDPDKIYPGQILIVKA